MAAATDFDPVAYRDTIERMSSEHLDRLDGEAERLMEQLAAINEQRKLIRGVMRTINPPEPKPAAAPKPKGASQSKRKIGEEKLSSVRRFLLAHADVDVTTRFLIDEMTLSVDQAHAAVNALREDGFLRLAGRSSGPGAARIYRVMDAEAVSANGH